MSITESKCVRFETFMVVIIKIPFLWYVMLCNSSYAFFKTTGTCWFARIPSTLYPRKILLYHAGGGRICLRNLTLCVPACWKTSIISSLYRMLGGSYWSTIEHYSGRIARL